MRDLAQNADGRRILPVEFTHEEEEGYEECSPQC